MHEGKEESSRVGLVHSTDMQSVTILEGLK
jgi:hypothetical protein